ncbi:MAG: methyltransferase domain-containing protein [Alphaproteobacteria bacterium]|nr:MAG: methyltransferase domain-containing protein [Alphaproteobacteria bacterium]
MRQPSFRERFWAWWEGYEIKPPPPRPITTPSSGHDVRFEPERPFWETARVRLAQDLWGEGFITPGDAEYVSSMAKYFGLDPAMSVLDIGAGLGGATRTMSENFGVWVTGLESRPELVEAGMALSVKSGLAKRAPVVAFDPANLEGKPNSIDCIFSKDFMYSIKDKAEFLKSVEMLLKSRGQFLFTDYVIDRKKGRTSGVEEWIEKEPTAVHPWSVEDYREVLSQLHMDIRVVEDNTQTCKAIISKGWADFARRIEAAGDVEPDMATALLEEADLWARRMALFDAGELKVCRFHVLKRDTKRLLSSW